MNLMKKDMLNKFLLFVDLTSIVISFLLSAWILYGGITRHWLNTNYGIAFSITVFLYIAIYYLYNAYHNFLKRGFLDEMIAAIKINTLIAFVLMAVMFVFQQGTTYSRAFFFLFFMLNILITYIFRQYLKVLLLEVFKKSKSSSKVMIITTSDYVDTLLKRFKKENEWEYEITYISIIDQCMIGQVFDGIEIKADYSNMFQIAKHEVLDGVFIHIPSSYQSEINLEEVVLKFQNMGIMVDISINTFGLKIHEKVIRQMSGYNVLTYSTKIFDEGQMFLKRMTDIIGGLIGCIITVICGIIIAPAIRLESPGPILFSQIRIGKNGRRFRIYKFRSMYVDAEERLSELIEKNEMEGLMFKMKDDPRITKVGKFLRKTSLDEFPQFFNVLMGDMSLVGTRPPIEKEFLQYEGRHKRRLALKSGITGLWQVSGRSDINNFEEVVKMDLEYIDNWSIVMDLKILLKTIGVVLFHKGSR